MVSKKIDLVTWLTNWFQTTTNKVNSWSSITSHTKYPSEKLVKDSLDAKADSTHSQTSATVTESSSLGRLGTSSNATQHDINVAINNLINTGGGSGEAALACVSDYYIDAQTNEIALTYCTGKVITNISKTTSGLVDTYTITYNDNTTYQFTVTNGADGSDGIVDIVTNTNGWNSTTSDSKVPSEKLVKNSLDGKANSTHTHTKSQITDFPTIPSKTSDLQNDSGFLTSHQDISGKEDTSNKVTSLSSSSTDTQYPSAKIVYDSLNDLHTSDIKIGSEPLTNIWTGATITEQAALNTLLNNHIGEIDARLQKEEIVYGSIYKTDSSKVYISGTYNKVCESVNSQHPLSNEMILFKLPNDLNSSSTKSIYIKVIYYTTSYASSQSYYELGVKYNNATVKENTFASNTIILLKLNVNRFDVVGVFSPNSTGSYNDLTDKPTIPSKTSDLTNDSGFLTSHQSLANYVQKSTTTGLLTNDGSVNTTLLQNVENIGQTISGLSDVATSGDYDDLINAPTNLSDFNDDVGYASSSHSHNISDLNNTTTVSVVVTYTDNTTETINLLKYTGS